MNCGGIMCTVVECCVLWRNDVSFGGMKCTLGEMVYTGVEWSVLWWNYVYCGGVGSTLLK